MHTGTYQQTAQIIPFPKRFVGAAIRQNWRGENVVDLVPYRLPLADFGDGWYHAEAIAEDNDVKG
jgi:hypothetical protein